MDKAWDEWMNNDPLFFSELEKGQKAERYAAAWMLRFDFVAQCKQRVDTAKDRDRRKYKKRQIDLLARLPGLPDGGFRQSRWR